MLRNSQNTDKNVDRDKKDNVDISIEKVRNQDIKRLKTLEELMKEERWCIRYVFPKKQKNRLEK